MPLLLWLPWLGNAPLRDWDEAGIARTALEFAQAADLNGLLPTRWGEPYLNKPQVSTCWWPWPFVLGEPTRRCCAWCQQC